MGSLSASSIEALGQSESFLEFQARLAKVAPVDRPVLLIGERGTGKELAANRLHFLSQRWDGPLVTLNCSTLSESLIESELFGHEKGAFTGAEKQRSGRFELADGGTLFLDEIGTIPKPVQEKILRVVEYGSFERVGGTEPIEVDVRIIGATNVDLLAMAQKNEFKQDLLDRLSFEVLFLPPLRSRREDIMLLADHFAGRMAFELGHDEVPRFSRKLIHQLERHAWKGNVRELKNVVERAVYQAEGRLIDSAVFNPFVSPYPFEPLSDGVVQGSQEVPMSGSSAEEASEMEGGFKESIRKHEIQLVRSALERARFSQRRAAELLDLTYDQFRGLLKKHKDSL
ncbi:phage shock protein operon transcriptional activator [Pontiellaceae bacterium B12227]|nr:phage shock protein operon transcriptional activator [Pontiellaceae bacterium B12227]